MSWNLEGNWVEAEYAGGFIISGVVTLSRVKYGGDVQHMVKTDFPVATAIGGSESVLIQHDNILKVRNFIPTDLQLFTGVF